MSHNRYFHTREITQSLQGAQAIVKVGERAGKALNALTLGFAGAGMVIGIDHISLSAKHLDLTHICSVTNAKSVVKDNKSILSRRSVVVESALEKVPLSALKVTVLSYQCLKFYPKVDCYQVS